MVPSGYKKNSAELINSRQLKLTDQTRKGQSDSTFDINNAAGI